MAINFLSAIAVDSDVLYTDTTNDRVGIGTTSPGQKLHVDGNIRVGDSADVIFSNRFYALSNAHVYLLANSGYDLKFYAGGTEKMVVNSAGNVGIGTTSPSQKLEVNGNIQATGTRSISALFDANHYMRLESSSSGGVLKGTDGGVITTLVRTYGDSYFNGGNFGIGTTSPSYRLDIQAESPAVRIRDISDANSFLVGADNSGGYLGMFTNDSLRVYTNSLERIRVDSSGNVGIGTTSPGAKLHLFNAGYPQMSLQSNGGTWQVGVSTGNDFAFRKGTTGSDYPLWLDSSGNVGIGTTSPAQRLHVSGKTRVDQNGQAFDLVGTDHVYYAWYPRGTSNGRKAYMGYAGASTTDFTVMNQDSGAFVIGTNNAERMRITSNGNVGIGTTSPSSPLTFGKSVYGDFDSENFYRIKLQDQGGTHNDVGIGQTASGNMGFNITSGNAFIFNNGTSGEIARFNGTGLGIGTTSPGQKLHVNGNARVDGDFFIIEPNPQIFLSDTNHDSDFSINLNSGLFKITDTTNSADRITLDSSGNVGIGTTSPLTKLNLADSSSGAILSFKRSNSTTSGAKGGLTWVDSSNYYVAGISALGDGTTDNSGELVFRTSTGEADNTDSGYQLPERMRIDSSGNVGIGTTSPNAKLHVYNTGNGEIEVERASGALVNIQAQSAKGLIGTDSNHTFSLKTNSSERLTILNSGNVGIGTTSPARKLEVYNGSSSMISQFRSGSGTSSFICFANTGSTADQVRIGSISSNLVLSTNYTERMRIDSSGNVGIGTTSPSYKLEVDGTFSSNAIWTTASSVTEWGSGTTAYGTLTWDTGYAKIFANSGNQLQLAAGGASTDMTIDTNGKVGIGTTSPSAKLDSIAPDGSTNSLRLGRSDNSNYWDFNHAGNDLRIFNTAGSGSNVLIGTNPSGTDQGNRVGIGTASPSYKLDVNGDVRITQDNQLILSRSGASGASSDSCVYVDNTYTSYGNPSNIDSDVSSFYGSRHITFRYNGTIVGHIQQSSTSGVAYNTSASDERLKKNIENWQENILDKFEQIEPKKFNFISEDEGENKTKGFIAQKMVADFPEAYPSDYSEEKYYSFNPSGMVVYLMKAVKELVEKNKELENRLQTLENK